MYIVIVSQATLATCTIRIMNIIIIWVPHHAIKYYMHGTVYPQYKFGT